MSLELTVLRLLKYRDRYERLARSVPKNALDTTTRIILDDFGAWFREFPDAARIEPEPFLVWFKGFRHPGLTAEAAAVFEGMLRQLPQDVSPEIEGGMMERLVAASKAYEITEIITQFQQGEEIDLLASVRAAVEDFEMQVDRKVKDPQVRDAIEDLLKAEEDDKGLHWRWNCLNRHMKPLRGGDFVVLAARPDKGKTTAIADNATHMGPQIDLVYPGENRSILWFNNEGPGKKIVLRCFQAALFASTEEMVEMNNQPCTKPDPEGKIRTLLREKYNEVMGRMNVLRVFDVHGYSSHEVEDLMRLHKPALVIFDMIDNISFAGAGLNNGQRTDQLLEAMYQWARMMCVKYDCAGIATSQISAEGDGLQFPTLPMLKDSKTGKQGAAEVIITIGAVNDPSLDRSRYIGCTKNKLVRSKMPNSPKTEMILDGDRGRYVEAPT